MRGTKMEQAKKALKYIVNALTPEDRFSIVQFNTDVEVYKYSVVAANEANKKGAISFINDLDARGGTNISGALQMGTSMLGSKNDRPAYMVLMTDGEPTVGETNWRALAKSFAPKRDIRLFDFGVGYDVNTALLNKLAEEHHGTAQYVEPDESLEATLSSFYQKIKSPVLSNVHITYSGVDVKDVYPREVKDIFAGSQILLLGKYKNGGSASVTISGDVNKVGKTYSFPMKFAQEDASHTYLPRLWAMRRIAHLTDVAQENNNSKEVVDEIVVLSQKYGIISQYTSFLVTDPSENHRWAQPSVAFNGPSGSGIIRRGGFAPAPSGVAGGAAGGGGGARLAYSQNIWRQQSDNKGRGIAVDRFQTQGMNSTPAAMPMSDLSANLMASKSMPMVGVDAVKKAKQNESLKVASVMSEEKDSSGAMKIVGDKTFYLRDGFWTESAALDAHHPALETIEFGSKRYFDLIGSVPGISKYLSVGDQVIFIYKDHGYKIVKSGTATTTG
jgi:Ca-activated chloride channel family protein